MIAERYQGPFKSEGERRIAYFLEANKMKYHYEPGVLVNSPQSKPRIWYPDFYLPEFGSYIEYYGLVGRDNYDRGIKRKNAAYSEMGLDVIPVYPWTFAENWQHYIMQELKQTTLRRYKSLMDKPYWAQDRLPAQNALSSGRGGHLYGQRRRY
ncbi:MAG: hypothetical protein C4582_05305 [Desulfobacteraceae bacterium]|nr:MAG: hypothetical protein C4582_05305 [Desulfobacteraceae bacterium]